MKTKYGLKNDCIVLLACKKIESAINAVEYQFHGRNETELASQSNSLHLLMYWPILPTNEITLMEITPSDIAISLPMKAEYRVVSGTKSKHECILIRQFVHLSIE